MKRRTFRLLLPIFCISMILITGCKDPCKDISCGDNGTCADGACVCEALYEGDFCEFGYNDKFGGNFVYSETCDGYTFGYSGRIVADALNPIQLNISIIGFADVIGVVDHNNPENYEVPLQLINSSETFEGSGSISTDRSEIFLNYTVKALDNSYSYFCNGTFVPQ